MPWSYVFFFQVARSPHSQWGPSSMPTFPWTQDEVAPHGPSVSNLKKSHGSSQTLSVTSCPQSLNPTIFCVEIILRHMNINFCWGKSDESMWIHNYESIRQKNQRSPCSSCFTVQKMATRNALFSRPWASEENPPEDMLVKQGAENSSVGKNMWFKDASKDKEEETERST